MRFPRPHIDPVIRLHAGPVTLRSFTYGDGEDLHRVRNHPSVRRGMRDDRPIPPEAHRAWVRRHLLQDCRQWLFLVESRDGTSGMTVLRDFDTDTAEIGVMLVDAARRRRDAYFAAHLTAWFAFEVLGLRAVVSKVPRRNRAARRFNESCGFEAFREPDDDFHYFAMDAGRYYRDPTHRRFRRRWPIRMERAAAPAEVAGG